MNTTCIPHKRGVLEASGKSEEEDNTVERLTPGRGKGMTKEGRSEREFSCEDQANAGRPVLTFPYSKGAA